MNNWRVDMPDGRVLLKVCNFPCTKAPHEIMPRLRGASGESMWVIQQTGDDFAGTGTIDNDPALSDLKHGDLIEYGGGTRTTKPVFVCKIERH